MGRNATDLIGRKFGTLTVIRRDYTNPASKRFAHWLVKCECGWEKIVRGASLTRGYGSGWCGNSSHRAELSKQKKLSREYLLAHYEHFMGQRFGHLLSVARSDASVKGHPYMVFRCDCGREDNYKLYSVVKGQVTRCRSPKCPTRAEVAGPPPTERLTSKRVVEAAIGLTPKAFDEVLAELLKYAQCRAKKAPSSNSKHDPLEVSTVSIQRLVLGPPKLTPEEAARANAEFL
jgi:hypothetical protein